MSANTSSRRKGRIWDFSNRDVIIWKMVFGITALGTSKDKDDDDGESGVDRWTKDKDVLLEVSRKRQYILYAVVAFCIVVLMWKDLIFSSVTSLDGEYLPETVVRQTMSEMVVKSKHQPRLLVICIGTAPSHFELRQAAREGWLTWIPRAKEHHNQQNEIPDSLQRGGAQRNDQHSNEESNPSSAHDDGASQQAKYQPPREDRLVEYRFFTDHPSQNRNLSTAEKRHLMEEAERYGDIEFQAIESGYGSNEHNAYGRRGLYQMNWMVERYDFDFFLRIDDDVFLCLHRLIYEIQQRPKDRFFWGRYWCNRGRNRADENFMLFSRDIVELLTDPVAMKLIPFDDEVTLAWNFGLLAWILEIEIFDDQKRIDSQQGYLTTFMHDAEAREQVHADDYASFCHKYVYAHHVSAAVSKVVFDRTKLKLIYNVPPIVSPRKTCAVREQSFIPARHARQLPHIVITPDDSGKD